MEDEDRPRSDDGPSPEEERARAVAEVLAEQAVRGERRRQPTRTRPTTTWARVGALVLASLAAFYVWFAAPAWMAPAPPPPVPAQTEEAALRLAVYVQAQQVERFRRERGRLPDVLEEMGEPLPGLFYDRLDARTFRLRAVGRRRSVRYVSSDTLGDFAEGAERILGSRR